jgi:hypothetical protein
MANAMLLDDGNAFAFIVQVPGLDILIFYLIVTKKKVSRHFNTSSALVTMSIWVNFLLWWLAC